MRRTVLDGVAHQELPLARLIERLKPKRNPGRSPVFEEEFMFVLQSPPKSGAFFGLFSGETNGHVQWGGLTMEAFELAQMEGQFDLTWEVVEGERSLSCVLKYNSELFDETTIRRMETHLRTLLREVVDNPDRRLVVSRS